MQITLGKAFTANRRIIIVFGKAKCKLCGENVRFALRHLKQKHSSIYDKEITKMKMPNIMEKYFT
jgi:hypothetical protein